jgi:hypothetical protein
MYSATSSDTDDFEEAPPFFFGPFPFFPMMHRATERSIEIGDEVRVKRLYYTRGLQRLHGAPTHAEIDREKDEVK